MTEEIKGTNGDGPATHLDWLRARHGAITAERLLEKDIPGYGGRLVARFKTPPFTVVARAQELAANPGRNGDGLLYAHADFLVAACKEILYREDDGTLVPVDPSGEPRRFDPDMAALFKLEVKTAREVVRGVFGNDFALAVTAGEVLGWASESHVDASDTLAGEFEPVGK